MSFILDALRKSEQERRQSESLVLTSGPATVELPRRRVAPWAAGAVAAAFAFVAIVYWILLERRVESTVSVVTAANTSAAQSTDSPIPAVAGPATAEHTRAPGDISVAPELKTYPLMTGRETTGARALAEEAMVEPRPSTRASRAAPGVSTVAVAPSNAAPIARMQDPIKFLRAMPPDFQHSLPELVVNIHIYAPREADRILYINNHQYHSGDRVGDGIVVEDIVQDGAILSFRGQRFKLPRPS